MAFDALVSLAQEHGLTSYDAAYLEVALRVGAPLATVDAGLARAARAAGVQCSLKTEARPGGLQTTPPRPMLRGRMMVSSRPGPTAMNFTRVLVNSAMNCT